MQGSVPELIASPVPLSIKVERKQVHARAQQGTLSAPRRPLFDVLVGGFTRFARGFTVPDVTLTLATLHGSGQMMPKGFPG